MTIINFSNIKEMNVSNCLHEELIFSKALLRILKSEYESSELDVPAWIDINLKRIDVEIKSRKINKLEMRLKTAELRRAELATPEEKRKKLDEEIEELRNKIFKEQK